METTEKIKPFLKNYVEQITQPDPRAGRNMYKCPICKSGHGEGLNSNGAFSITPDGLAWKCFSCENGGDIFTLIGLYEGLPDFIQQKERAKQIFNVTEFTQKTMYTGFTEKPKKGAKVNKALLQQVQTYIDLCHENINKTNYFTLRGLDNDIIKRFSLGYDPKLNEVIIPYNKEKTYFIARSVENKRFRKPKSENLGIEPIFNQEVLQQDKPVFITESPIDAISIIKAGGQAVALGGTGGQKLIDYIKNNPINTTLVLCLDNDEPGRKATDKIKEQLKALDVSFLEANFNYNEYPEEMRKDPNDLLRADFNKFTVEIKKNIERADPNEKHKNTAVSKRLNNFFAEINPKKQLFFSTGFKKLDKILDGGLYPGLYILGAVSSLGKTTLSLQIADNIAIGGADVLIFSLEMGANELISKTLSRLTYQLSTRPKTSREINKGAYSPEETEIINKVRKTYLSYGDRIYIYEGIGNIGAEEIKEAVERHIKLTGKTPVIVIDYLQILAPYELRATDKQNIDKSVLELKRLSRDYKTPVIGISSFNRDSYNTAVSMQAFKESGAIEYGSDVLIALQPGGMGNASTDAEKKKNKDILDTCKSNDIRDIEAVILKNRNGATNRSVKFKYHAKYNCYEEVDEFLEEIKKDYNYR